MLEVAISRFGGPEVFEPREVEVPPPAAGELRIRHTAIGVNFTDVHGRRGDYAELHSLPKPMVLGMEAVGIVEQSTVRGFKKGDRVAYASRPLGAYSEVRNFPAARCVHVPKGIDDESLAACFLKALTIQVLTRQVYAAKRGDWVVFHAAAGGVGTLAGQWLRARGVRAIGIVGSKDKIAAAKRAGYKAVLVHGTDDWPAQVRELSGGVCVVYDSVGQATWEGSIACLAPRGRMVCFGNSSGMVPPISVNLLRDRGSLQLTWVRFSDYLADGALELAAKEVFQALKRGHLRPRVGRVLPLQNAAEAHRLLESRSTTGSLVLRPRPGSA
ncbi:MAG TPA: quinone oxidoreductase [Burkholderiales bacterium]|nr:quinone oxidoreductase [Burkholderiales bacterium]